MSERVVNVQRNEYSGGHFLGLEMLTGWSTDSSKSDEIRARITATEPMDLVHYVVIGRGDILLAKTVEVSISTLTYKVTLLFNKFLYGDEFNA